MYTQTHTRTYLLSSVSLFLWRILIHVYRFIYLNYNIMFIKCLMCIQCMVLGNTDRVMQNREKSLTSWSSRIGVGQRGKQQNGIVAHSDKCGERKEMGMPDEEQQRMEHRTECARMCSFFVPQGYYIDPRTQGS